ncbi:hypothetical protein LZG07_13085 [Microbacterium profundi]|uniref:DUF6541 family protein n=1 Tax=Microbacterium profundi TaxID=450380 RepID=UPI001F1DA9ED|nr:DUF6541 family protein [Microbacterium profundi]MCE7482852.1 hypothetical protein [Microbacterium profundi]
MITDWIAQSGLIGLALLVIFGPGLLIGVGLRLRGLTLWAAAPGVSVGLLAILAIAFPYVGVRWGHLSVGIAVLVVATIAWGTSLLVGRSRWKALRQRPRTASIALLVAGLVVGAGLNAARLLTYIGLPTAISQTNDAVFHLNALRWVAETGSASSLDLTGLIGGSTFYPAAWHAVASLVALDTELIPVAANVVALAIAAVVWPLGIAFLARVISRGDVLITALAAALSAGLLAFPQLMFEWGVLYPYALSVAIVPTAVALTIMTARSWAGSRGADRVRASAGSGVAAILAVVATTLSQPSSVLVWAVLVMLWATGALFAVRRRATPRGRAWIVATIIVGWMAVALVWVVLVYLAGAVLWRAYRSPLAAAADVLLNSHSLLPPAIGMSVLLLVGLVLAARGGRMRWLAIAWAGVSLLYVISVSTDLRVIKRLLTGPWYGDSFRLAAIVPIIVVPLAAIGLAAIVRRVATIAATTGVATRRRVPLTLAAMAVIAIAGAVSVAVSPVILLRVAAETDEQSRYTLNDRSYLSTDEYELLRRLPELVPDDALLIANPSTGAAFAFMLGERDIIPRTWSPPQSTAWDTIAADLRDAGEDEAVCEALAAYGQPAYVLDFGIGGTGPGEYLMPGMTDFDDQPGFEEIEARGDASLWRITACD